MGIQCHRHDALLEGSTPITDQIKTITRCVSCSTSSVCTEWLLYGLRKPSGERHSKVNYQPSNSPRRPSTTRNRARTLHYFSLQSWISTISSERCQVVQQINHFFLIRYYIIFIVIFR